MITAQRHDAVLLRLPPLRVNHFLLSMTAVAIVTTLDGAALKNLGDDSTALTFRHVGMTVAETIAITVLILGSYWWMRGALFFDQAGHFLLAVTGISFIRGKALALPVSLSTDWTHESVDTLLSYLLTIRLLEFFVVFIVFLLAARNIANRSAWKRFFSVVSCYLAIHLCWIVVPRSWGEICLFEGDELPFRYTCIFGAVLSIVLCGRAISADLRSTRRYHWTHWCGVGSWLAFTICESARFCLR